MFISAAPTLRALDLVLPPLASHRFPEPFQNGQWFFSRGCGALAVLLRALNVTEGATILLPSYLCGDVVSVFRSARIQTTTYSVDASARFDPAEIVRKITPATRAVMVVHYFGFPQQLNEIRTLTEQAGVLLIEDCAHALFGRFANRELGRFGDASIFSLRKTLPLPDGGALVVNNAALRPAVVTRRVPTVTTAYAVSRLLVKTAMFQLRWRPPVARDSNPHGCHHAAGGGEAGHAQAMSRAAMHLFRRADVARITAARRSQFAFYLDRLRPIALYQDLPDGVVPFSFPVLVKGRDGIVARLARRGLSFNMGFPEAPAIVPADTAGTDLTGAQSLAAQLLELPVHQDLRSEDLEFIVDTFSRVA